jgi:radical SAM superfamily enzyme YgiQ (UPF0313 family)
MAGFILGFDGERAGAGDRIIEFVEATAIPKVMFGMLQALPNTALWKRLKTEGRLLEENQETQGHQMALMNFVPTRPLEELAREYASCFWELYEPRRYLSRVYRHFMTMKPAPHKVPFRMLELVEIRAVLTICWRQGVKRNTRFQFWRQLFSVIRRNPNVFVPYLSNCALIEHFLQYRQIVGDEIETQLAEYLAHKANSQPVAPQVRESALL